MMYFLTSLANINKRSSETFSFSVWAPEEVKRFRRESSIKASVFQATEIVTYQELFCVVKSDNLVVTLPASSAQLE